MQGAPMDLVPHGFYGKGLAIKLIFLQSIIIPQKTRFDVFAPELFVHLFRENSGFWKLNAHQTTSNYPTNNASKRFFLSTIDTTRRRPPMIP